MTDTPVPARTTLALKLCRLLVVALIALLASATVYVVALGGVTSAGNHMKIIETRVVNGAPGGQMRLALPDEGVLPPGAQTRSVIVKCTNDNGKQNCLTTGVPPGQVGIKIEGPGALPAPASKQDAGTPQSQTPAAKGVGNTKAIAPDLTKTEEQRVIVECREENGQRHCTTSKDGTPGTDPGQKIETIVRSSGGGPILLDDLHGGPDNVETENVRSSDDAPSPFHNALSGGLAGISLVLLLLALFNLERLLGAVEGASIFSHTAVRRLQWIGVLLLATACLPHFALPQLIENAATSLSLGLKPWPAETYFSLEFNLMLLVAGLFLVLMARVVEEGVWLHDEMRGTV